MKKSNLKSIIKEKITTIKNSYLIDVIFILSNLINGIILRIITINNGLSISPLFIDFGFLIITCLLSLILKEKNKIKYYIGLSIIFNLVCIINSIYYHYYSSFASFSLLGAATFASDVSDAIIENVLKPIDLIYIWQPIFLYSIYKYLIKNKYLYNSNKSNKKILKSGGLVSLTLFLIASILLPHNAWNRLYKLWNRESVVRNFGIYTYQLDDFIQSFTPEINSMFNKDKAYKNVSDYYTKNKYKQQKNEYTDIFKGKNIIVIHAESMQTFPMYLKFNKQEVTPNLNKLAKEGLFFSNFYSQVGVGTSSDAEFTFNTSLMPSTKGTVFVNYFDREYISIPKLLKEKGYYTYSMHANTGDFWNRNIMHKNLGYDKFYSKDSYEIDEEIGLGLSDKSFFKQSVEIINNVKNEKEEPFYSLLIMLSNHTPFSDLLDLMPEYQTTTSVVINNQRVTRNYLNNSTMGNYLRSVHYADDAIGEFINELDEKGLLENTILVIYGDHDARLDYADFNMLYNYDPIQDKIKTPNDEGYIEYNKYNYELDRKVPLIIWTKDKKFNKEITTPMGMIDVLPTLGNMIGIHSEYQMGKDIFNIKNNDNMVTFIDGSFLTSKVYYNSPKGEIYQIKNEPVTKDYINKKAKKASEMIEISNDIISYDIIKELKKGKIKPNTERKK